MLLRAVALCLFVLVCLLWVLTSDGASCGGFFVTSPGVVRTVENGNATFSWKTSVPNRGYKVITFSHKEESIFTLQEENRFVIDGRYTGRIIETNITTYTVSFALRNITYLDTNGNYSINFHGSTICTDVTALYILVQPPKPNITKSTTYSNEFEINEVTCHSDGLPEPFALPVSYQWSVGGVPIPGDSPDSRVSGSRNETLTRVRSTLGGQEEEEISCVVREQGSPLYNNASVTLTEPSMDSHSAHTRWIVTVVVSTLFFGLLVSIVFVTRKMCFALNANIRQSDSLGVSQSNRLSIQERSSNLTQASRISVSNKELRPTESRIYMTIDEDQMDTYITTHLT